MSAQPDLVRELEEYRQRERDKEEARKHGDMVNAYIAPNVLCGSCGRLLQIEGPQLNVKIASCTNNKCPRVGHRYALDLIQIEIQRLSTLP